MTLINFSSDSYLKSRWMCINVFLMKIPSIVSSVCQKELNNCFMITSMVLLQINEPLRHRISILLRMDPSGRQHALELHAISVRCSSVCSQGCMEQQPGQAGAAVLASHPWLPGSTLAPLSRLPAAGRVGRSSHAEERHKSSRLRCSNSPASSLC